MLTVTNQLDVCLICPERVSGERGLPWEHGLAQAKPSTRIGVEAGEVLVEIERATGPRDRMLTGCRISHPREGVDTCRFPI